MWIKNIPWLQMWKGLRIVVRLVVAVTLITSIMEALNVYMEVKPIFDKARAISSVKIDDISDGTFINEHNTRIYDKDGKQIGEINIGNFEYVTLDNISPYIKNGYIAVEDRNFYTHSGIDYKALLRASSALVRHGGEVTQGGSTITQQVLKNNVLTDLGSSWDRKLVEFFLAPEFESMYSKDQIMEYYCNTNYYQNGCYGVESASQYYFGKSAKDLTLAEAAGLCGISNNPSRYNPVKNPDDYKERREKVLKDMLECGYITEIQYNEANKDELKLILAEKKRGKESYQVSYAIHCATLREMERNGFVMKYVFNDQTEYEQYNAKYKEQYNLTAEDIRNGGYEIYTSFDETLQNKLQEYVDLEMKPYQERSEDGRYTMQASATLVDNSNGLIVAIVGGRGTTDEYNRAYQSFRQPGSCAKPILAYGPAFDTGLYYPSKKVKDKKSKQAPSNWDGVYRGEVSIREALERSINAAAFYVMQDITPKNCVEYLGKMEFSGLSYLDTYNGSMALGGFTYGTTTSEMAKAYNTLVNNGVYDDEDCVISIKKLVDGQIIEVFNSNQARPVVVYQPDTSYMLIDCLKGVLEKDYATGKAMQIEGVIAAGKTGTTNSNKDGWFCGMTPYYTLAVWAGYDNPKTITDMGGGKYPGAIYKDMMSYLMENKKGIDFKRPSTIEEFYIDSDGDRTDRNTGEKDLFSAKLIQEAELAQAEERERKKQLENEQIQKEQDYLESKIREDIKELSKKDAKSLEEYEGLLDQAELIRKRVNELISSSIKKELNDTVDMTKAEINNKFSLLRVEHEEKLRIEREAQEKKKKEAEEELKIKRVQIAEQAVTELENWKNSEYDRESIIKNASDAVNLCKGYDEYEILKMRYDTSLTEIRAAETKQRELEKAKQTITQSQTSQAVTQQKPVVQPATQATTSQSSASQASASQVTTKKETTTETTTELKEPVITDAIQIIS